MPDLQVLLALTTNWGDIGSVDQYVQWCGASDHTDFFTDASCIQMFNDHTDKITSRVNTVNGRTCVPAHAPYQGFSIVLGSNPSKEGCLLTGPCQCWPSLKTRALAVHQSFSSLFCVSILHTGWVAGSSVQ